MLVDNSLPSHFASDFSDFINTDLFAPPSLATSSPSSDNDSSPPQSPFHNLLTTPPQDLPPTAFPDFDASSASTSSFGSGLSFLDDDTLKLIDPSSFDFMSLPGMQSIALNYPNNPMSMPMDLSMGMNMDTGIPVDGPSASDLASFLGIDPSLVGTPAPSVSTSELETVEEESSDEAPERQKQEAASKQDEQRERLTLTITPAKVGGHGRSRKGTVQSGGIVKKNAHPSHALTSRDKENSGLLSTTSGQTAATIAANAAALKRAKARAVSETPSVDDAPSPAPGSDGLSFLSAADKEDLAIDWRPPPEVLAKMTSKEKRQLRNKISARNFRVRRKEYITTLEGDIAERDRLLDAIRTELGSTQSENLALRQEIAALKKILLEGQGPSLAALNLPPPAPLAVPSLSVTGPVSGASSGSNSSATLGEVSSSASAPSSSSSCSSSGVIDPTLTVHSSAANANVSLGLPTPSGSPQSSSSLLIPNTQKDLPSSPRLGAAFWGGAARPSFGVGMGGGVTPVHTVLVPDMPMSFRAGVGEGVGKGERNVTGHLQENMNPALNGSIVTKSTNVTSNLGLGANGGGFEGWADSNMLTMKTLDAYRMHLWGKMAATKKTHQQMPAHRPGQGPALTGLASHLKHLHFASPSHQTGLSTLLSGKQTILGSGSSSYAGLPTPPGSPHLKSLPNKEVERFRDNEKEHATLAAVAGQTLFQKLGSAFWDAFSGNAATAPGASLSSSSTKAIKDWDPVKVKKVLEGKAVVRVVDVEPEKQPISSLTASLSSMSMDDKKAHEKKCKCGVTDILEESMRSLTVSKKS